MFVVAERLGRSTSNSVAGRSNLVGYVGLEELCDDHFCWSCLSPRLAVKAGNRKEIYLMVVSSKNDVVQKFFAT